MKVFFIILLVWGLMSASSGLMLIGDSPVLCPMIISCAFFSSSIISLAIIRAFGSTPMKALSIFFMVAGLAMLGCWGYSLVIRPLEHEESAMCFGLFGSSLFGSGAIALAITLAFQSAPTKAFAVIMMVVGFLLGISGIAGVGGAFFSGPRIVLDIFGSTVFCSGVIALAITQAIGKKS